MTFQSINDIHAYILSKMQSAVDMAKEQVYQIINKFVKEFYAEYSPDMYERTYQLFRSLVKVEAHSTGDGYVAEVYFDLSSLVYITGACPSGSQVMGTAAHGGHGAEGLKVVQGGTAIWDEPLAILNEQAIEILKKYLIANGIPLK